MKQHFVGGGGGGSDSPSKMCRLLAQKLLSFFLARGILKTVTGRQRVGGESRARHAAKGGLVPTVYTWLVRLGYGWVRLGSDWAMGDCPPPLVLKEKRANLWSRRNTS